MPRDIQSDSRCILLLSDAWSAISEGICGVNYSIALALSRYKGIRTYSTVFEPLDKLSPSSRALAADNNVTLISLATDVTSGSDLYSAFDADPLSYFADAGRLIPNVSHIVGHSPITARAALRLRDEVYPDSRVIVFYHVIPRDVDWLADELPYAVPSDAQLVATAERADVVYSVSEKLHWYYTAKFRNRCQTEVDHRLFLPQCSSRVFDVRRPDVDDGARDVVVLASGQHACAEWTGLDIAACAVNKVAIEMEKYGGDSAKPNLLVAGTGNDAKRIAEYVEQFVCSPVLRVASYGAPEELYSDLERFGICVVPSRAEPFGYVGLHALSAGIPTLIAEDCCLASVVKRLTSEPEVFLVPVTPSGGSVRQDGSVWRDRILGVLENYQTARDNARQLQMALKRDETTKETHDNFISYVLGGIHIKHELTGLRFQYRKDEEKELPVTESFNNFLLTTMKQCWRFKHHPLTGDDDLYQILPGVDLPINELVSRVTDKIEDGDRRIVGVDRTSGAFVVYCPTPDALGDLWAMCDVINRSLSSTLLSGDDNPVLDSFKLEGVTTRTVISGPEFLQYKNELVKNVDKNN